MRATAPALGMKSMARDYGYELNVALETDSVSGRGMSLRLGAGKVRHVDTQWLSMQGVFHIGEKQRFGKCEARAMKQTS